MDTRARHVRPTWWGKSDYRRKRKRFNCMHCRSLTVLLLWNIAFTLPVYVTVGIPMKPPDSTHARPRTSQGTAWRSATAPQHHEYTRWRLISFTCLHVCSYPSTNIITVAIIMEDKVDATCNDLARKRQNLVEKLQGMRLFWIFSRTLEGSTKMNFREI